MKRLPLAFLIALSATTALSAQPPFVPSRPAQVMVSALPATTQKFVETQPVSINNFRLIVANWLSSNILSYSLVLVATCFLVGIATSALLSRSGRRH